jgi:hypothetical protein
VHNRNAAELSLTRKISPAYKVGYTEEVGGWKQMELAPHPINQYTPGGAKQYAVYVK